jgi:hypothetical protein
MAFVELLVNLCPLDLCFAHCAYIHKNFLVLLSPFCSAFSAFTLCSGAQRKGRDLLTPNAMRQEPGPGAP